MEILKLSGKMREIPIARNAAQPTKVKCLLCGLESFVNLKQGVKLGENTMLNGCPYCLENYDEGEYDHLELVVNISCSMAKVNPCPNYLPDRCDEVWSMAGAPCPWNEGK